MEVGGSKFTPMEISIDVGGSRSPMEVNLFPSKYPCKLVEVNLLSWKLVEASMKVHGSFHCQWKWKLPLLPSIAASTMEDSMSFHITLRTSVYIHEYRELPAASTRLTLTLTLTLSWSYLHGRWPTSNFHGQMEVHGSSVLLPWKLGPLSWKLAYF